MNAIALENRSALLARKSSAAGARATRWADGESLGAMAMGSLAVVPWVVLIAEVILAMFLFIVGAMFAATFYLIFVTFFLWYAGLWLAVALNTIGVAAAGIASTAPTLMLRSTPRDADCPVGWIGLAFSLTGLMINAALLGLAIYALAQVHGLLG